MQTDTESFPRRYARTQRFTLGAPRAFTVAPDGSRVVFLRSRSGTDRAGALWALDLRPGQDPSERLVADPVALLGGGEEDLSPQERARRERSREGGAGIVSHATDAAAGLACFALSGRLFCASTTDGAVRELSVPGPVTDPRPSPDGRLVAYAAGGALRVVGADGEGDRALAEPESGTVAYGLAEFVAAEEMGRDRGFWWAPGSDRLLVARYDDAPVRRWWIADPANPGSEPRAHAYPAAGTPNADVQLFALGLDGGRTEVLWDREAFPYLARVHWSAAGSPLILVQSRDQRTQLTLAVDPDTGATRTVLREKDPTWLELFAATPCWSPGGELVRITDESGARALAVGGRTLTDAGLHLRAVLDVGEDDVLVSASAGEGAPEAELGEVHVHRVTADGVERVSQEPGVHTAVRAGGVTVLVSSVLDRPGAVVRVLRDGEEVARIASHAADPGLTPRVSLTEAGARRIPCAVLLPAHHRAGDLLPVLMDPYGGPHGQRVYAAHNAHLTSQWLADQGFAVIVADGRGTPGRSPAWEKSVAGDLTLALEDQIDALHDLAERYPLDLSRVAIRGWSFGGYLAAMAVLRRPDVFAAGIAGAPVSDLRLYDTHYTERYLGDPAVDGDAYAASSLVTDEGLSGAAETVRPLMVIHGLADDNVVVAHALRLSSALLAAGRPHEVLPLSGVTHMTPQERVAENLLLFQVDFLRRALGVAVPRGAAGG
ncbi:prolyl oligopeptidase family serine peptidase [Streptomyces sp. NPDC056600]|uniref:prolyl oligopeptidase family serine peptidase n=1 Tax=Streptomyces sp. NPDC056600 TaxID=3345874 RepID=UPI0036ACD3D9